MIKRHGIFLSACVCVFLCVVAPTMAADEAHGASEGPNLFTGDLGNIFWSLLTFVAVIGVLGKFAWRPILTALQKREQFIHDSLAQAKSDREAAEAKLKEYEHRLQEARTEASAIVDEGRRDADVVRQRIHADAKSESDAMVARAKREIALARDTAVKELYTLTANLATSVAGKIIQKELDASEHERLVSEAVAAMGDLQSSGR